MSKTPKVSIIIPSHNATRFVQTTIDKTFQDFEIVVVDDGSTDNTKEVLQDYGDEICCHSKANGGMRCSSKRFLKMICL